MPAFVCGLLLAAAPVSLFFVLETAWFSLRNTVSSFPGIALMADAVILGLWNFLPGRRRGPAALAAGILCPTAEEAAARLEDYGR